MKKTVTIIAMIAALALATATGCTPKRTNDSAEFQNMVWGGETNLTAQQHIQIGLGLAAKNKPEMALLHFARAQAKDPENLDVRVYKGDMFMEKNASEPALNEYRFVLEKQPDHARANQGAGVVYYLAGLEKEARTHLERALSVDLALWKAHCYLGIILDRQGSTDKASQHFQQALALSSGENSAKVMNNLGVTLMARRDYQQAADMFQKSLETGGTSARTYNNLGLALVRLGRIDEALQAFQYGGDEARAYNNLGYVLLMDGRPHMAIPYFEKAVDASPTFYEKAFDNLKRARMAAASGTSVRQFDGSTPNPPPGASTPMPERAIAEAAALPAAASGPAQKMVKQASFTVTSIDPAPAVEKAANPEQKPSEKAENGQGDSNIEMKAEGFGLHVSSWRDLEDANEHGKKLSSLGFDPFVTKVDLGEKGVWHRVLVGNYGSIQEAVEARPVVLEILELTRATVYRRVQPE